MNYTVPKIYGHLHRYDLPAPRENQLDSSRYFHPFHLPSSAGLRSFRGGLCLSFAWTLRKWKCSPVRPTQAMLLGHDGDKIGQSLRLHYLRRRVGCDDVIRLATTSRTSWGSTARRQSMCRHVG